MGRGTGEHVEQARQLLFGAGRNGTRQPRLTAVEQQLIAERAAIDAFEAAGGSVTTNGSGRFWYYDGVLHRDGAPAAEYTDGKIEWWQAGQLHRDDGPAISGGVYADQWWCDSIEYPNKVQWQAALDVWRQQP